ncbi:MAG: DedA family protein [Firmicutes bacterium]|nr:DedA family protein [Bacillota bacterium]
MGSINNLIDIFLHLDKHLNTYANQYGIYIYVIIFLIIFCETGLVVTPFLPGDSLIFAAGAIAAIGSINIFSMFIILSLAAVLGDTSNYQIGHLLRSKVLKHKKIKLIKIEYIDKTQEFFNKYGKKTIIIARFIPIIRTFAPFVAGVGEMPYKTFISFNIIGGIMWVTTFLFSGYFFGNLPLVKDNFSFVILGIIFISFIPGVVTFFKNKFENKK